jgi:hypothetical protein
MLEPEAVAVPCPQAFSLGGKQRIGQLSLAAWKPRDSDRAAPFSSLVAFDQIR